MDSVESFREQFQCSICLDVFTEPVSTPCGHNYCMSCINSYWAHEEVPQCPLCKETFVNVPQLRVNTEFRDILDLFKKTRASGEDGCLPVHLGDVLCDFCCDVKCKAVKSCLICLASYCNIHLEPHHRVQALKWHTLINPVGSLEDRACTKHSKLKEFFCRNHQSCVCAMCMRDSHVTHDVVSLEEELKERRAQLVLIKRRVDQNLEEKTVTADRIQNSIKQRRQEVEKTKAETIKSFAALVAVIEAKKMKVIELLEEKQQAAEQEADVINQQLQREIEEDQRISTELIDLIKSEDDFRLLQALPSVSSHSNSMSSILRTRTVLHVETVKMAVTRTVEMLNEQMENVIRDVHQRVEEELRDSDTDDSFNDELSRIQQEYMTKVTLDPNTAHPCLIVSEDRKQVRDGGSKRKVSDTSSRFDCLHYVLGNEGFSSGRFYFEVTMEGQTMWEVGVTRDNISRKGVSLCLSPENGCWTLGSYWGRCQANTNPPTILPNKPERLGVFVDYNQKLVSFYDVDSRALIYSFTGCSFSAGTDASAGNSSLKRWVYTGTLTKTTLYPLFRPSSVEKDAPLQISPVRGTKRMN